jgi:hypothetical protein
MQPYLDVPRPGRRMLGYYVLAGFIALFCLVMPILDIVTPPHKYTSIGLPGWLTLFLVSLLSPASTWPTTRATA